MFRNIQENIRHRRTDNNEMSKIFDKETFFSLDMTYRNMTMTFKKFIELRFRLSLGLDQETRSRSRSRSRSQSINSVLVSVKKRVSDCQGPQENTVEAINRITFNVIKSQMALCKKMHLESSYFVNVSQSRYSGSCLMWSWLMVSAQSTHLQSKL